MAKDIKTELLRRILSRIETAALPNDLPSHRIITFDDLIYWTSTDAINYKEQHRNNMETALYRLRAWIVAFVNEYAAYMGQPPSLEHLITTYSGVTPSQAVVFQILFEEIEMLLPGAPMLTLHLSGESTHHRSTYLCVRITQEECP